MSMRLLKVLFLWFFSNCIIHCEELNNDLIVGLIKEVHSIKRENEALKEQVAAVVSDNYKLKEAINDLLADKEERTSKQSMDEHADSKRLIPVVPIKRAAFSVSLQQSATKLGNYQTIVFDQVITNIGNVYSPLTGAFTAPCNGTYFFTGTIMNLHGEYIEAEIAWNGNTISQMYSNDKESEQGTNSVVLELTQGDMVWMRHTSMEGSNVSGNSWTTFSGFQISEF